jgi:UPF0755 protein
MADGRGRTSEEREAARIERERKRAARSGRAPADPPPEATSPPEPAPPVAPPPTFAQPVPGSAGSEAVEPDGADGHVEPGEHDGADGHLETGEREVELPSGTRRVSHGTISAKRESKPKLRRRRRQGELPGAKRSAHSWLGRTASVVALVLAAALIWFLVELFQPFHGSAHGRITVTIPLKASSSQIGDLLAKDGVISSSFFFELRATLAGERGDLRPGVYHLQLGMSYGAVLTALTKAPPAAKVTEITITEGRSRNQIDALLRAQHVRGSYIVSTRSSRLINPRAYGLRHPPETLEGFLFPDTYQLVEPIKIPALVTDQITAFKQNFAKVGLGYAHRKHLTAYDVLTIASLIEAEADRERDRPLVASVIYNRLADGMLLQFDSTTRFATGNYNHPLTVSQLHSRSPWNTHTHTGLPPTPIDSPGLASIQAAAHPARTNYLFFFARPCNRGTVFASNYSQFLNLANRYKSTRC